MRKLLAALALGAALLILTVAATAAAQEDPNPPTFVLTTECLNGQPRVNWTAQFRYDTYVMAIEYQVGGVEPWYRATSNATVAAGGTISGAVGPRPGQTVQLRVIYAPLPYTAGDPTYTVYSEVVTAPDCSAGTTTTTTATSTTVPTTTSTTVPTTTTTTTTPPAPPCDCSGRQVTTDKPSKFLERVEKNRTGLTCFNIRLLNSGGFLVSGSGTHEALDRVFG